jgi:hypothetical protein
MNLPPWVTIEASPVFGGSYHQNWTVFPNIHVELYGEVSRQIADAIDVLIASAAGSLRDEAPRTRLRRGPHSA